MNNHRRTTALQFIFLLGIVSLFGDITYEGARSITGPYLALLGAGAAVVGLVGGIGEFLGYAVRLASGYIADRTKALERRQGMSFFPMPQSRWEEDSVSESMRPWTRSGPSSGPLIFSAEVFYRGGYREGFLILWIPVFFCMAVLLIAQEKVGLRHVSHPEQDLCRGEEN